MPTVNGMAVAEAMTANETIYQRVARLHREQTEETERLQALESKKRRVRLSKDEFVTLLMLENSIALRITELAEAEMQLRYDVADVRITEASVRHDKMVAPVKAAARHIVGLLGAVHIAIRDFERLYATQHELIEGLTYADGTPLFLDLPTPRAAVRRLLTGLPQGGHLINYLLEHTSHAPTVGETEAALDAVPGVRALSGVLVQRYLASYQQQRDEGVTHARDL